MRWKFVVVLLALAGCGLGDPGDLVGEMTVRATLQEDSCGSAVGDVPTTADIHVKFYERSGMLTWMGSQGTFQAEIDEEGNFVYQASASTTLRQSGPDGLGNVRAACAVDSAEEIRGKLIRRVVPDADGGEGGAGAGDGGTDETAVAASVTATDTLRVAPSSGSDCSDMVGVSAGLFESLPCRVVVDLSGSE